MSRSVLLLIGLFFLFTVLVEPPVVSGQAPSSDWRTIETAHFRLHYSREYGDFARHMASQMESIREEVSKDVGIASPQVIDVIVQNPYSQLNGEAISTLAWPRIVLWAYPPEAGGELGRFSDWSTLVLVHEEAHIAHLLRPTRNPFQQLLARVNPFALGPLIGAPRWVIEGFATVVEGKLTGFGRPNGSFRAVVLKTWARAGRLPSYTQLASDHENWLGMSMAYLTGSSFLEWLERRQGEGSLKRLWASMSARQGRTFEAAFQNVFGDPPSVLYGYYTAQLTHDAVEAGGTPMEGEVWQAPKWRTERPDVSPDGETLVTVVRSRTRPPRMVTYSTAPDAKGEAEYAARVARTLEQDPQDVAPVRSHPLPRKPLHELIDPGLRSMESPRFIGSSGDVVFVAYTPDANGDLHGDLFRWSPSRGTVDRLTERGDLRDPAVAPDGKSAIAVRTRQGKSHLIRFDFATAASTDLTDPAFEAPVDDPAISKDGVVAFVRNGGKGWALVVLAEGKEQKISVGNGRGDVFGPSFSADGLSLFVTVSEDSTTEIWRVPLAGEGRPLTRSSGSASYPVDDRKGGLFYLGLNPDGLEIRHFVFATGHRLEPQTPVSRENPEVTSFASSTHLAEKPYGIGRQEVLPLLGFNARPYGESSVEALVRAGDIVGKLDTTLALSFAAGSHGEEGIAVRSAWRGSPVAVETSLFSINGVDDRKRISGAEISGIRQWHEGVAENLIRGGIAAARNGDRTVRRVGITASSEGVPHHRELGLPYSVAVAVERAGDGKDQWTRYSTQGTTGVSTSLGSITVHAGRYSGSRLTPEERFVAGGSRTSLEPPLSFSWRVFAPELQRGALGGTRLTTFGIELAPKALSSFHLFANRFESGGDFRVGKTINAFGLRTDFRLKPMPILKVPGLVVTAGIARLQSDGKPDTNVWAGVRWEP